MKMNSLLLISFIAIIGLVSCSKEDENTQDTPPTEDSSAKKYLVKVESLGTSSDPTEDDVSVTTTYKYDASNRPIVKVQKEISGGTTVSLYDSIVYSYTGSNPYPSKKELFDKLSGGDLSSTSLYTYDSQNRLIRDSVVDESATTYSYAADKVTVVTSYYFFDELYTSTDVLTKDASGNNFVKIVETGDLGTTTVNLTFDNNVLNPYLYSDPTSFSSLDNEDDIGLFVNLFGKNAVTKVSASGSVINIKYENVSEKWPGKMILSDPSDAGNSYTSVFTYK